jgi:2-polyprenyl-3-methyl-5-hydroxy-6-metoxy-1,4-benzoquinol methylase
MDARQVIPCAVCGGTQWSFKFHKQDFDFIECKSCGLLQLHPIPTPEQLDEHYRQRSIAGNYELAKAAERLPTSQGIFDLIAQRVPAPGRIFDVGCFDGQLLDIAKARGWETWGLELQGPAAEHANANHDGRVVVGPIEGFRPDNLGQFDVVTAVGLIEHVVDVDWFMLTANALLKTGGLLVIQTPNYGSIAARTMGKYWFPIAAPEHIHYFSAGTLRLLCESFGFSNVFCRAHWKKLRVGYALDQMSYFGEEIGRVVKKVRPVIPSFIEQLWLPLYGGEMLFAATKLGPPHREDDRGAEMRPDKLCTAGEKATADVGVRAVRPVPAGITDRAVHIDIK